MPSLILLFIHVFIFDVLFTHTFNMVFFSIGGIQMENGKQSLKICETQLIKTAEESQGHFSSTKINLNLVFGE